MRVRGTVIAILVATLVLSNAFWAYAAFNMAVSINHRDDSFRMCDEALAQVRAILPIIGTQGVGPTQVVKKASDAAKNHEQFEKDGFIWVGSLGLRFGQDGRIQEAVPIWSSP